MPEETLLQDAINKLSYKKETVVTDKALRAKEALDHNQRPVHMHKQLALLSEFNRSMQLLVSIFKASSFDELVMMASRPLRIFVLNFFIGMLRGIGFCVGVFLVGLFLLTFFWSAFEPYVQYLNGLFSQ